MFERWRHPRERALRQVLVATLLLSALLRPPRLVPESFELVGVGRCLLGLSNPTLPCDGLDLLFWSPAHPLLAGALSTLLPPLAAGGIVSLAGFLGVMLAAGAIGGSLRGRPGWFAGVLVVGLTPVMQMYAMMLDARILGLAFATGAAALLFPPLAPGPPPDGSPVHRRSLVAGLLAGAAALTRPEHLLVAGGLTLVSLRGGRRPLLSYLGGALLLLVPYWVALSLSEGRPTLLPRGVQAAGFALVSVIPEPWARALVGEGAARLPLRTALRAGPWPTDIAPAFGLDPLAGLHWLVTNTRALIQPWSAFVAALGLLRLLRTRATWQLLALGALAAPAVVAVATPPGIEPELPVATLLPLALVNQLLVAFAIAWVGTAVSRVVGRRTGAAALVVGAMAIGSLGPRARFPDTPENSDAGRAAAAALARRLPPGSPVLASFRASPLVHLAGMRWVPWPSPWEAGTLLHGDAAPTMALISASDADWSPADLGLPPHARLRPIGAYGELGSAVLLLEIEAE
ncbi:MAG: hypothetical protein D6798_04755 [Deltaproteobacteria bacterium]|nr:MAG: hypothetical protein D6798_04755 [Deltaproteobacteria bacterium]